MPLAELGVCELIESQWVELGKPVRGSNNLTPSATPTRAEPQTNSIMPSKASTTLALLLTTPVSSPWRFFPPPSVPPSPPTPPSPSAPPRTPPPPPSSPPPPHAPAVVQGLRAALAAQYQAHLRQTDTSHLEEQRRRTRKQPAPARDEFPGGIALVLFDATASHPISHLAFAALSFQRVTNSVRVTGLSTSTIMHTFLGPSSSTAAQMLDALYNPVASLHEPSPLANLKANCTRLEERIGGRLTPARCAATLGSLRSVEGALRLRRDAEAVRGRPFAAVFLSRLDVVWRTAPPLVRFLEVAVARGEGAAPLAVLPQHCEPQAAADSAGEVEWKATVCGARQGRKPSRTLVSPAASECTAATVRLDDVNGEEDEDAGAQPVSAAVAAAAAAVAKSHEYRQSRRPRYRTLHGLGASSIARASPYAVEMAKMVDWEQLLDTGASGVCDTRRVTSQGRSYFVLPWWTFLVTPTPTHTAALADAFATMATPTLFADVCAHVVARLASRPSGDTPWHAPPQWTSAGFHWAWQLVHRPVANVTIGWSRTLTPDVDFTLPARALSTAHAACEPSLARVESARLTAHVGVRNLAARNGVATLHNLAKANEGPVTRPPSFGPPPRSDRPPPLLVISPPGTDPLAHSCVGVSGAARRFLCAADSTTCMKRSADTPIRQRSAFGRAFIAHATSLQRRDRRGGMGLWRNGTHLAAEMLAAWEAPCKLLLTQHCRRSSGDVVRRPPVLMASTLRGSDTVGRGRRRMQLRLPGTNPHVSMASEL